MKHGRIVADHTKAICFLIADGVRPENKGVGYILRRLLRRVLSKINLAELEILIEVVVNEYSGAYPELKMPIKETVITEAEQFGVVLEQGLKELTAGCKKILQN
jgi:alanyl-tRNA synthetase